MPLVSVIIPIYNKELRLKDTIKCVLSQTFKDFELILIDDGSTDNSAKIALDYKKEDLRIKYYSQENRGVSVARNRGIGLAQGEYITFLDADDRWADNFLEEMINAIGNSNVCYCGHYYYINSKKSKARMRFLEGDILDKYIKNITTPNTNSWLIKKDYLNKFDLRFPIDLNWGEDMTFFLKVLLHDKNVKCVDKYLTEYHLSDTNSLSSNDMNKIQKDIIWMEGVKEYILANERMEIRAKKAVKYFDSYRIPAAIIYRLHNNMLKIDKKGRIFIENYQSYINKIKLTNGVRSLKLIFYKHYVYIRARKGE